MPTPSTFAKLDIINQALTGRMGEEKITNLENDTSKTALIMRLNYQQIAEACLTRSNWRFATKKAALTKLSAAPEARYSTAWQLPPDYLKMLYVFPPENYEIQGIKKLLSNNSSAITIDYIRYVKEGDWPPWFREFVIAQLTVKTCKGITGDDPSAEMRNDRDIARSDALFEDAQQQPNQEPLPNPFIDCRY